MGPSQGFFFQGRMTIVTEESSVRPAESIVLQASLSLEEVATNSA